MQSSDSDFLSCTPRGTVQAAGLVENLLVLARAGAPVIHVTLSFFFYYYI